MIGKYGRFGQLQDDLVALADAERLQSVRNLVRGPIQLRVRERLVAEIDGDLLGQQLGVALEVGGDVEHGSVSLV